MREVRITQGFIASHRAVAAMSMLDDISPAQVACPLWLCCCLSSSPLFSSLLFSSFLLFFFSSSSSFTWLASLYLVSFTSTSSSPSGTFFILWFFPSVLYHLDLLFLFLISCVVSGVFAAVVVVVVHGRSLLSLSADRFSSYRTDRQTDRLQTGR